MSKNHNKTEYSNYLIKETSPYLLQHASNPVEWYPWKIGLQKAKEENKPLLISIGYAACHWCHVMAHESFEDPETAAIMNDLFINIKIDREERPDLDSLFQKAVSLLTGRAGGWPLTVFATPDAKPFAGGTYFPKKPGYGLPSFKQVLQYIASEYEKKPQAIHDVTQKVISSLKMQSKISSSEKPSQITEILDTSLVRLMDNHDTIFGGFGYQPKFPQVSDLRFMLLSYHRRSNAQILEAVTKTLDNMAAGGIYDHLGFGFHRYSVDRKWMIPHFEKMLYDNAQLVVLYLEAFQVTKNKGYADIAGEILEYLQREMKHKKYGGFYSSQDADSEGEEGKFFVWTLKEIKKILGEEDGEKFARYYGVTEEGNFEGGYSVLHETLELTQEIGQEILWVDIQKLKEKLFSYREKREKPFLNDNVILSWNALTIYALVKASFVLKEIKYLKLAEQALSFIIDQMQEFSTKKLYRTYRKRAKTYAFAEDYALLIFAFLETFAVTGNKNYLIKAEELQEILDNYFWDPINYGYFFSGTWQEEVSLIEKPVVTFSLPSANSISLENLLRLYHYTGKNQYLDQADNQVKFLLGWYVEQEHFNGDTLQALDMYRSKPIEIISIGGNADTKPDSTTEYLQSNYLPHLVFLNVTKENQNELQKLPIITQKMDSQDLIAGSVYICKDLTCSVPLKNGTEINLYLNEVIE